MGGVGRMGDSDTPWVREASRVVYRNPWVTLREDQVIRPDGVRGTYAVLELRHRSIAVVPVTDDGDTLLVGQHRYPRRQFSWEVPQGGGALDVPALEAARRELREETGITAARWTHLGDTFLANSTTDGVGSVFLAEDLTFGAPEPEAAERITVRRLPLALAVEQAMRGEILEILSIVALARADHYLRTGRSRTSDDQPG